MNLSLKLEIVKSARTQRAIANQIGMSEDRLSDIVRGQDATQIERAALARVLGTTEDMLFDSRLPVSRTEPSILSLRDVPAVVSALRGVAASEGTNTAERAAATLMVTTIERKYGLAGECDAGAALKAGASNLA